MHFDKITTRITRLSYGLNPDFCDPVSPRANTHAWGLGQGRCVHWLHTLWLAGGGSDRRLQLRLAQRRRPPARRLLWRRR